jgi:hypothetical protein
LLGTGEQGRWKEGKTDSAEAFFFQEFKRESDTIVLKDSGRGIMIQLPVHGGQSRISTDGGTTWTDLYQVRRE